jgi:hypothetical protein
MLRTYWNWKHLQRAASEYILFTSSENTPAYLPEYKYHWFPGESAPHAWYCPNSQPVAQGAYSTLNDSMSRKRPPTVPASNL